MLGDTQSRKEPPIKLVPLGYNSTANSDLIITAGSAFGDLRNLISNGLGTASNTGYVDKQNAVRIPKPYSGEITELYLTFRLRLGEDEVGIRSMWIGYANADDQGLNTVAMSEDAIKGAHLAVTGQSEGFQAGSNNYIQFNRLNITKLLRESARGKGWHGLVFLFDQAPVRNYDSNGFAIGNGYALEVFRLEAAARFRGTL